MQDTLRSIVLVFWKNKIHKIDLARTKANEDRAAKTDSAKFEKFDKMPRYE